MSNRPTNAQLTESMRELKLRVPEPLYHHVWRLIYEIEALQKENERLQHAGLEEAIEEAFGERMEINAKKYAEIIRSRMEESQ